MEKCDKVLLLEQIEARGKLITRMGNRLIRLIEKQKREMLRYETLMKKKGEFRHGKTIIRFIKE